MRFNESRSMGAVAIHIYYKLKIAVILSLHRRHGLNSYHKSLKKDVKNGIYSFVAWRLAIEVISRVKYETEFTHS